MENIFALIIFGFWIYTLYIIVKSNKTIGKKILWFGFVLMTLWVGMLFYYVFGREKRVSSPLHVNSATSTTPNVTPSTSTASSSSDFYVTCVNCGITHTNPTYSLCSSCGKDMSVKDTNKKCLNCGNDYDSSLSSCPYCGS